MMKTQAKKKAVGKGSLMLTGAEILMIELPRRKKAVRLKRGRYLSLYSLMALISPEELHFGFDEDLSHFPGFHPGACILVVNLRYFGCS